ncbi:MAG: dockerin type I repeat-containing protein, partial [Candidatus Marinimicrobia bacterium]|nr:dockerin type I repeat-containing protein [Candidatus Neomarinimicrobiota bacterium]
LVPIENSEVAYSTFVENGSENVHFESLSANLGGHGDVAVYCLLGAYEIGEDIKMFNIRGDVNADETINILDIVMIVNSILGSNSESSYKIWASDVNTDLEVNILDIVTIVNIIMNS